MSNEDTQVRYNLEGLSPKQAQVVTDALELVMRIGMGQLEYLMEFIRFGGMLGPNGTPLDLDLLDKGDKIMEQLKPLLTGFPMNASKGIGNAKLPPATPIAYEIFKVVRHTLAWDRNPEGGMGVHFDDPYFLKYSSEPKVAMTKQGPQTAPPDQLPVGCFLGRPGPEHDGKWAVIQADPRGGWMVVAEAESAATAVAKAKAKLTSTASIAATF